MFCNSITAYEQNAEVKDIGENTMFTFNKIESECCYLMLILKVKIMLEVDRGFPYT